MWVSSLPPAGAGQPPGQPCVSLLTRPACQPAAHVVRPRGCRAGRRAPDGTAWGWSWPPECPGSMPLPGPGPSGCPGASARVRCLWQGQRAAPTALLLLPAPPLGARCRRPDEVHPAAGVEGRGWGAGAAGARLPAQLDERRHRARRRHLLGCVGMMMTATMDGRGRRRRKQRGRGATRAAATGSSAVAVFHRPVSLLGVGTDPSCTYAARRLACRRREQLQPVCCAAQRGRRHRRGSQPPAGGDACGGALEAAPRRCRVCRACHPGYPPPPFLPWHSPCPSPLARAGLMCHRPPAWPLSFVNTPPVEKSNI